MPHAWAKLYHRATSPTPFILRQNLANLARVALDLGFFCLGLPSSWNTGLEYTQQSNAFGKCNLSWWFSPVRAQIADHSSKQGGSKEGCWEVSTGVVEVMGVAVRPRGGHGRAALSGAGGYGDRAGQTGRDAACPIYRADFKDIVENKECETSNYQKCLLQFRLDAAKAQRS